MLPQHILDQFARIPHDTTVENKYYGVFNKILTKVYFNDESYTVEPQYAIPHNPHATIDFVVTYVIEVQDRPIFFIEIKPPLHLNQISTRIEADHQMRTRFGALYRATPTPRLHGVSVMGQRLAFYCLDKATGVIHPDYVQPSTNFIIDTVPAARWNTDITTEDGHQRFTAVINDVKRMVAAL